MSHAPDERITVPVIDAAQARPQDTVCVVLERWFVSMLLGYASEIHKDVFWSGSEAQVFNAALDVKEQCEALVLAMECEEMQPEFTMIDCVLNWRIVGSSTWIPLDNVCGADGADGAPGEPGEPGQDGIPGEAGTDADEGLYVGMDYDNTKTDEEIRCTIADALTDWLFESFHDLLDGVDAAANTLAAIDAFLLIFAPAYIIADQITDAINEIITAGTSVIRAWDTVGLREDFKQILYCELSPTAPFITESRWEAYKDAIPGYPDAASVAYRDFLDTITWKGIQDRASIVSYGDANCAMFDACLSDTSYLDEFTDGMFGAQTSTAGAVGLADYYPGGEGILVTDGGHNDPGALQSEAANAPFAGKRSQTVVIDLGEEKTITKASFYHKQSNTGSALGLIISGYGENLALRSHVVNTSSTTDDDWRIREWTGTLANVRYVRYGMVVDNPNGNPTLMDEIYVEWEP